MPLTPTEHLGLVRNADDEGDWGEDHRDNLGKIDAAIKRIEDEPPSANQFQFDYGSNPDDKPLYFGKARAGVAFNNPKWTITRFYYDGERVDHTVIRTNTSWLDRATPMDPWP